MRLVGRPNYTWLLLAFVTIPAPAISRTPSIPRTIEWYQCTSEIRTASGWFHARRTLGKDGQVVSVSAGWSSANAILAGPNVSGGWLIDPEIPDKFDRGWLFGRVDVAPISRTARFRMEVTTHPTTPNLQVASGVIAGPFARWRQFSQSTLGVYADWSDVHAMAQGAGQIFIVARDAKGTLLGSLEVPQSSLTDALAKAKTLSAEAAKKAANYRELCEDIHDIVVT